jgi:hypothetical protein
MIRDLRAVCLLFGLLFGTLLTACSLNTYQLGQPLSADDKPDADVALGVGEVLHRLGPPHRLSATADGYVMAWEYWTIREEKIGVSLGFIGADFLNVDWGSARTHGSFLLLSFNHQHQLRDSTFSEWDSDAGGGQGLQPLSSFVSVVDVDDLLAPMPQHNWGAMALDRLPATLNRDSTPDTGVNGIQQRGTSENVGQNTLDIDR